MSEGAGPERREDRLTRQVPRTERYSKHANGVLRVSSSHVDTACAYPASIAPARAIKSDNRVPNNPTSRVTNPTSRVTNPRRSHALPFQHGTRYRHPC